MSAFDDQDLCNPRRNRGIAADVDVIAGFNLASGEIKPRNYINIGSNATVPSRITEILVVEGAHVKQGQLLAKLESVQPEADVAAQRATVNSTEADSSASEAALKSGDANIRTLEANLDRVKSDQERARA